MRYPLMPYAVSSAVGLVASRVHGGTAKADRIAASVGDHLEGVLRQASWQPTADIALLDHDLDTAISRVTDWELHAELIQLQSCWRDACGVTHLSRRLTAVSDSTRYIAPRELDARRAAADRGVKALANVRRRASELARDGRPGIFESSRNHRCT